VGHVGAWVAGKPRLASWRPWREAVVSGPDGVAVFDALHRRHRAIDALLYAFDLPELDGEDLRPLPLSARKAKLLARKPAGIVFNEHAEEDGAVVFWHACKMGLEGIVSKRLAAPYRSGPSRDWIKVKNPDSPAVCYGSGPDGAHSRHGRTGFLMRVFEDRYGWQPIDSAPPDKDVSLMVTDGRGGEPYRLPYPCRYTAGGWVSSNKGSPQTVVPTKWKPYFSDRKRK
jgi:hypothetical protein